MINQSWAEASLLGLPRELRDLIYQYALTDYEEVDATAGLLVQKRQHIPSHCLNMIQPWPQPPLTRVNRQLRDETLGLSYELGIFSVTVNSMVLYPLMRWAELIGAENCRRLKRVEVMWIADKTRGAYMRNGVSEFMAAERFRKSELGRALEPALNYENFFKVSHFSPITLRLDHVPFDGNRSTSWQEYIMPLATESACFRGSTCLIFICRRYANIINSKCPF